MTVIDPPPDVAPWNPAGSHSSRRILDNAADRALATRHASVPALWTPQP